MKNYLFRQNRRFFTEKVTKKLSKYADTILSPLKTLKSELEHRDVVFVTQQSQRWTAKELDYHSDAFAYYLVEQGFAGDKILFWSDVNHSLEYLSAAVGSIKAGSTIVNAEFENWEDIQSVMKESGADVLVVSPHVQVEKNKSRIEKINEAIPELSRMQYGDYLKPRAFPDLKQIIQISHKTIPGTEKFKHCLNYTKGSMTNLALPELKNENVFEIYTEKGVRTVNHQESLQRIQEFNQTINSDFSTIVNSAPIFYPSNFILGFIGGLSRKAYNVIPGTYNFVDILKLIDSQKSPLFIAEENILNIQVSKEKLDDVRHVTQIVKDVVLFVNKDNLNELKLDNFKQIFNHSKLHFYDELSFERLD